MLMHTRHSGGQREKGPPACASPLASIGPRVLRVHLFLETHPDPLWECLSQRGAPPQTQLHGGGLEPRAGEAVAQGGRAGWTGGLALHTQAPHRPFVSATVGCSQLCPLEPRVFPQEKCSVLSKMPRTLMMGINNRCREQLLLSHDSSSFKHVFCGGTKGFQKHFCSEIFKECS